MKVKQSCKAIVITWENEYNSILSPSWSHKKLFKSGKLIPHNSPRKSHVTPSYGICGLPLPPMFFASPCYCLKSYFRYENLILKASLFHKVLSADCTNAILVKAILFFGPFFAFDKVRQTTNHFVSSKHIKISGKWVCLIVVGKSIIVF